MRSFSFYKKFSLKRDRLASMLRSVSENASASDDEVGAAMGVNPYMIESVRGWLCKTNLAVKEAGSYTVSPFGLLVAQYDPHLEDSGTLWLLHFYLATEHAEKAEVWYQFFNTFASPHRTFTRDEWYIAIARSLDSVPSNKAGLSEDPNEVLKTYTAFDALGSLGLMTKTDAQTYRCGDVSPPPLIAAYMLLDTWGRYFPHVDTIRVSQVCQEPEMLGKLCIADRTATQRMLNQIQSLGIVVTADTQHEPVTRRYREAPINLVEQYYTQR